MISPAPFLPGGLGHLKKLGGNIYQKVALCTRTWLLLPVRNNPLNTVRHGALKRPQTRWRKGGLCPESHGKAQHPYFWMQPVYHLLYVGGTFQAEAFLSDTPCEANIKPLSSSSRSWCCCQSRAPAFVVERGKWCSQQELPGHRSCRLWGAQSCMSTKQSFARATLSSGSQCPAVLGTGSVWTPWSMSLPVHDSASGQLAAEAKAFYTHLYCLRAS